jgi:two-component system, cell cycle sensor histidine kinase and response regulator CckA
MLMPRSAATLLPRLPKQPLARLRGLLALFAIGFALIALVMLAFVSRQAIAERGAGALGLAVLVSSWARGYRRGRFPAVMPLIEAPTLLAIAAASGNPPSVLGVFYVGLNFRVLYGTRRDATMAAVAYLSAFITAELLTAPVAVGVAVATIFTRLPGLVISASVLHSLAMALRKQDRTEQALRVSERRYRTIVDEVHEVVFETDALGRWTFLSGAWTHVTGFAPEESLGRTAFDFVHPEDRKAAAANFDFFMRGRRTERRRELRLLDKIGEIRWVEVRARPVLDDTGLVVATSGTLNDVTERKRLEAQLLHAQKLEAVGQLAGGVAHDFNNLLTTIKGNIGLLREDLDAARIRGEELDEIEKAADRAASLTRQLLTFSRKERHQPKVLQINPLITNLDRMLRRLMPENIEAELRLHPDAGCVRADPRQLEQVITNLVVNARDAMLATGGGRLVVEASPRNVLDTEQPYRGVTVPGGAYVMLRVSDTGCGIDADTRERIFEPFFTTKPPGQGTGLGLSTVYGIVQQSRGHIWVESAPGLGATFVILFPQVAPATQALASPAVPEHALPSGETILVVEDEPAIRELLQRLLSRAGYRLLVASSGEEALRVAKEHGDDLDLLLTDVVMPGISGRVLADRLCRERPALHVLFISGYSETTVLSARELGPGRRLLPKPFAATELLDAVRIAMEETSESLAVSD